MHLVQYGNIVNLLYSLFQKPCHGIKMEQRVNIEFCIEKIKPKRFGYSKKYDHVHEFLDCLEHYMMIKKA